MWEWGRLRGATTAPVVGEMVRVPLALETEVTPAVKQLPFWAKQPAVRLKPWWAVEVAPEVPASPPPVISTPWEERIPRAVRPPAKEDEAVVPETLRGSLDSRPAILKPPAMVEEAPVPVRFKKVTARFPEKVEVELVPVTLIKPRMVEVPSVSPWMVVVELVPMKSLSRTDKRVVEACCPKKSPLELIDKRLLPAAF